MAAVTLLSLFPKPEDVLALTPEDFGGVIIELMPPLLQNGMFNPAALIAQVYQMVGPSYPPGTRRSVELAVAEAMSWLVTQGLLVPDPGQPSPGFYVPTRRAQSLKTRTDVDAFRKGRILPSELLPTLFAEKVVPLFRRGDHDIAVFQAFKEVEVAVRTRRTQREPATPIQKSAPRSCARHFIPILVLLPTRRSSPPNARPRCTCLPLPSVMQRIRQATGTWR